MNLYHNEIRDDGLESLWESLSQLKNLNSIDICDNLISENGVKILS